MRKITRAGLRTEQIEYMNLREYNDDDDGGTVIDRKLISSNNIKSNSRLKHGATVTAATAAVVVVFAFAVAVLRAFELFKRSFYFMIDRVTQN